MFFAQIYSFIRMIIQTYKINISINNLISFNK